MRQSSPQGLLEDTIIMFTKPRITPSEALYGFMAWLTTRDEPVTLSAKHDASIAARLIDSWLKANKLPNPRHRGREAYPFNIRAPKKKS